MTRLEARAMFDPTLSDVARVLELNRPAAEKSLSNGRTGRPSKLTPQRQQQIVEVVRAGNYLEVAAGYVGISVGTLHRWMNVGQKESSGIYRDFFEAIEIARAQAEVHALATIRLAGRESWQAEAWFLERTRSARYGRRDRLEVEHRASIEAQIEELAERLAERAGDEPVPVE